MNQTTNQLGMNNAGRDINQQYPEPGPGSFPMPETLKDDLCKEAENLLFKLESMRSLKQVLANEIDSYQEKRSSAKDLQETMDFINLKIKAL